MDTTNPASPATCFPTFVYDDAPAAVEFLQRAFGLEPSMVMDGPDGSIAHAELRWGNGVIMVGSSANEWARTHGVRAGGQSVCVAVDDPDAHHRRALAAGAEVVMDLVDTDYGARNYAARDPEGNTWTFGTYQPLAP